MADKAPNFKLGEIDEDAETHVVEYTDTVIAGDLLKVTGVTSQQNFRVAKHTAATNARYIAIYPGKAGELHEALYIGTVKATFGGNVTPGVSGVPKANKIVSDGTAASGGKCCVIISDGNANNDTGLILFNGGMT